MKRRNTSYEPGRRMQEVGIMNNDKEMGLFFLRFKGRLLLVMDLTWRRGGGGGVMILSINYR